MRWPLLRFVKLGVKPRMWDALPSDGVRLGCLEFLGKDVANAAAASSSCYALTNVLGGLVYRPTAFGRWCVTVSQASRAITQPAAGRHWWLAASSRQQQAPAQQQAQEHAGAVTLGHGVRGA